MFVRGSAIAEGSALQVRADRCRRREILLPNGQKTHGVHGEPVYAANAGFDPATKTGRFQPTADSPGAGAGQVIPDFSDGYTGRAPDIGAHQRGAPRCNTASLHQRSAACDRNQTIEWANGRVGERENGRTGESERVSGRQ